MLICPKTKKLVDEKKCIAINNLSHQIATFFSVKICSSIKGCPTEHYCSVFEDGWNSVSELLNSTMKE